MTATGTTPALDTQNALVLEHMQKHGIITSMQAFSEYGVTRLSARIFELRAAGYNINSKNINSVDRRGKACHYSEYSLVQEGLNNG